MLERILAHIFGWPARPTRGDCPGGRVHGGRSVGLHHRADLGGQGRPGHVKEKCHDQSSRCGRVVRHPYCGQPLRRWLKDVPPCDLAAAVVREAVRAESGIARADASHGNGTFPKRRADVCTSCSTPIRIGTDSLVSVLPEERAYEDPGAGDLDLSVRASPGPPASVAWGRLGVRVVHIANHPHQARP